MDRIRSMQTFSMVVSEGSFSKAAYKLNISPQLVSKYISQLEEHLNVRLLSRTTRQLHLTEDGMAYLEGCNKVLEDLDLLENNLNDVRGAVRGTLRISAPMSFGMRHLSKALVEFQNLYPDVTMDLQLNDRKVDIIQEGFDLALRVGHLQSSSLIARKLTSIRLITCASPDYLKKAGTPDTPEDLVNHKFLGYSYMSEANQFTNIDKRKLSSLKIPTQILSNNGDILMEAAMLGAGIVLQPSFIAYEAIKNKELKIILQKHEPEPLGLYAIYANRTFLPAKIRYFVDFISNYYGDPPYWDKGLKK